METQRNLLEVWWQWMLHSTWQVAVLAALIWGIASLFKKTSASFRYALWLLVFVKLLVPPFLATPWSVGSVAQRVAEAGGYSATLLYSPVEIPESERTVPPQAAESAPSAPALTRPMLPWKPLLLAVWLLGAGTMLLGILIQFLRFKRLALSGSLDAPEWLRQMAGERARLIGLDRTPALRITGTLSVPAVFGAWRPTILIPGDWLERFDRTALGNILTHELAHVKRRDLSVGWLASCLTCCYWFHPLVWVAHRQLRREREMACDDWVLRSTNTDGKEYAGTILKGAESVEGMIPAGAGFLGLMELSENLLQRIRSVGDVARKRRMGLKSALTLGAIVLGLMPMQAVSNAEPAADTPVSPATAPADRATELALYEKANPEVQAFIKHTCESFGRSGLWLDAGALDGLSPEEREKKIVYIAGVLEGEYGRQQCESLAEAGVMHDTRLLPGLKKVAAFHRDDQDYDCRAKWMAVAALGRQGDASAIPVLIPLVDHGNQNTRMWARGSLVRLTGQSFDQDKAAWGAWWNAQGKEPNLSEDDLKPWVMPGTAANAEAATEVGTAPEILSSNPAIGASGIDPSLTTITVTFDQDMKGGFSWTGGGELYPETTAKPRWIDKRTCELPVKLVEGRVYRVGINSKSFKNFCGANGIPARDRVLYFATKGAPPEALAGLTPPTVVSKVVGESKDTLLVTFDKPMGGGCSWTKAGGEFPEVTDKITWSEDKLTCTLPVKLEAGKTYRVGINSTNAINFQSESGVPVEPEVWEFTVDPEQQSLKTHEDEEAFTRRVAAFEQSKAMLTNETAAFRNKHEVYESYAELVEKVLVPLAVEASSAKQRILERHAAYGSPEEVPVLEYDKSRADAILYRTSQVWFEKPLTDVIALVESGEITVSETLQTKLSQFQRKLDAADTSPSTEAPYNKGTPQYDNYMNDLGYAAGTAAGVLQEALFALPADLQEARKRISEEHNGLVEAAKALSRPVPVAYGDEYEAKLNAFTQGL